MSLAWSDWMPPDESCSYNHVIAETPLGRILIDWKGWKDMPTFTAQLPWGVFIYAGDLEEAKRLVQEAWDEMVGSVRALAANEDKEGVMAATKRGDHVREVWRRWWESDEEKDTTIGEFWDKMAEAGMLPQERAVIEAAQGLIRRYTDAHVGRATEAQYLAAIETLHKAVEDLPNEDKEG